MDEYEAQRMTGSELRFIRKKMGWKLEQMGDKIGVHFTMVGRWERKPDNFIPDNRAEKVRYCYETWCNIQAVGALGRSPLYLPTPPGPVDYSVPTEPLPSRSTWGFASLFAAFFSGMLCWCNWDAAPGEPLAALFGAAVMFGLISASLFSPTFGAWLLKPLISSKRPPTAVVPAVIHSNHATGVTNQGTFTPDD